VAIPDIPDNKVTHCGYWMQARRKWCDTMLNSSTEKASKATVGYRYCNKLVAQDENFAIRYRKANMRTARMWAGHFGKSFCVAEDSHLEKGNKLKLQCDIH
jgi:hypothetical protein